MKPQTTGRYAVTRYAWHYEVIDQHNGHVTVFSTRNRDRAHRECDRLNVEHRKARTAS